LTAARPNNAGSNAPPTQGREFVVVNGCGIGESFEQLPRADRQPVTASERENAVVSGDLRVGYTWRRPTGEDAEAIFALVSARNTDVIGFADFTLDDTRDMLSEPGF
jgi:hypothetical protein